MHTFRYKLLLVLATLIWGASFVVIKDALDAISPGWLMSARFLMAGLVLSAIFWKRVKTHLDKAHIIHGAILGAVVFMAYWVQNIGILYTTPGKNAFLTAMYCVMVPFLYWVVSHKPPKPYNIIAALLCIVGVGFMSLKNDFSFTLNIGDALTLIGALGFAVQIVLISLFAKGKDMIVLTIMQLITSSLVGFILSSIFEPVPALEGLISLEFIGQFLYLSILASSVAMLFQNVGQAHVPPAQASLFMSLEGVFGVFFSVVFYGEQLTLPLVIGFALIFIAILISELMPQMQEVKE